LQAKKRQRLASNMSKHKHDKQKIMPKKKQKEMMVKTYLDEAKVVNCKCNI
jgi:hypothetical protein